MFLWFAVIRDSRNSFLVRNEETGDVVPPRQPAGEVRDPAEPGLLPQPTGPYPARHAPQPEEELPAPRGQQHLDTEGLGSLRDIGRGDYRGRYVWWGVWNTEPRL